LEIAQNQHRDHEARIGRPFVHDAYMAERTALRDQLKAGLSQATPEPGTPPVAELSERIKALKAAHTIDAAPERTASRRIAAEEPVTARIRRRTELAPAIEPDLAPNPVENIPHADVTPFQRAEPKSQAETHSFLDATVAVPIRPQLAYRRQVARDRGRLTANSASFRRHRSSSNARAKATRETAASIDASVMT
jgi:hypothetical protein